MSEPKVTIGWVPEFFMHEDGSITKNPDWVEPERFDYSTLTNEEIIQSLREWPDDIHWELALVAADRLEELCDAQSVDGK